MRACRARAFTFSIKILWGVTYKKWRRSTYSIARNTALVNRFLGNLLGEMGGFKFSEALEIEFSRRTAEAKNKHRRKYCDSKQHIVINKSTIQESLQLAQKEIRKKAANVKVVTGLLFKFIGTILIKLSITLWKEVHT